MPQNCLVLLGNPTGVGALLHPVPALVLCCNSLSSGPWALLVLLLQESFGVILDDPFAAQFPPWMPLPFLNTLFSLFLPLSRSASTQAQGSTGWVQF